MLPGAEVAADAVLSGGTFVGARAPRSARARSSTASSLFDGAVVGGRAPCTRLASIGRGAIIGSGAVLDGVVVGDRRRASAPATSW